MEIAFWVPGVPSAQGSKRGFVRAGKVAMVDMNKSLQPWRDSITWAAVAARKGQSFPGAVRAELTFVFPRPKSHYGTGRNAGVLKPGMPHFKTSAPDIDKLERAAFDALTASGIWRDDAYVVQTLHQKVYGDTPMLKVALYEVAEVAEAA